MKDDVQHLWPKCKAPGCNQQVYFMADRSLPVKTWKEPKRFYKEADGTRTVGGDLTSTVVYPSFPHWSGLCYYHLKKYENFFDAKYPLPPKVRAVPLGLGGLRKHRFV